MPKGNKCFANPFVFLRRPKGKNDIVAEENSHKIIVDPAEASQFRTAIYSGHFEDAKSIYSNNAQLLLCRNQLNRTPLLCAVAQIVPNCQPDATLENRQQIFKFLLSELLKYYPEHDFASECDNNGENFLIHIVREKFSDALQVTLKSLSTEQLVVLFTQRPNNSGCQTAWELINSDEMNELKDTLPVELMDAIVKQSKSVMVLQSQMQNKK